MKYNIENKTSERLKRELEVLQEQLAVKEQQLAQSKKAFQEMHRRGSSADMTPRASVSTARSSKQVKQHQQQVQQLQQDLENRVRKSKTDLERVETQHKDELEKADLEFQEKEEMYETQIAALKHSLEKRSNENERLHKNVARISKVIEEETEQDPTLVRSPPMRSIQAALTEVDIMDGWLSCPRRDNIRKFGWEGRFCTMNSETFLVHKYENSTEAPLISIEIAKIHHAKGVRDDPAWVPSCSV